VDDDDPFGVDQRGDVRERALGVDGAGAADLDDHRHADHLRRFLWSPRASEASRRLGRA
jgi:hypothetical protein